MTPPHLTSDLLKVPHGFFGAKGGVSTGIYASLNTGQLSDDDKEAITENRARIQTALEAKHLISLHQIHSDTVIIAKNGSASNQQADGLVTTQSGLAISALSADCGPVYLRIRKPALSGPAMRGGAAR